MPTSIRHIEPTSKRHFEPTSIRYIEHTWAINGYPVVYPSLAHITPTPCQFPKNDAGAMCAKPMGPGRKITWATYDAH